MGKTLRGPIQRPRPLPPPQIGPPPLPVAGRGLGIVAARLLPATIRVSVVCPTRNRAERHPGLYDAFAQQDYADASLWVLDDSIEPSSYLEHISARDTRVHYIRSPSRVNLGVARNELLRRCDGDVVAHFDDDDWYAPGYLSEMLRHLVGTDSDLVKLSQWTDRNALNGKRFVYDGHTQGDGDLWGWGFTYVYRRYVATRVSFPETVPPGADKLCEDYPFLLGLRAAGLRATLVEQRAGLAEHVWHGDNTTGWHLDG